MEPSKRADIGTGNPRSDYVLLAMGLLLLAMLLTWTRPPESSGYLRTVFDAATTLRGEGAYSDVAQDMVGFRALVEARDPYPVLGPAFRSLGIDWDVRHTSTHPPTAYVLAAPIACLPWNWASAVWAWLMLALLAVSLGCLGLRPLAAVGLAPIALLWPPMATSLGQITIPWLFGLSWAFAWLRQRPFWSGVGIGLASLTKFFPGILILLCFRKRLWRAVPGLALTWLAALAVVLWLSPHALARYAEINRTNSVEMMLRADNSSLLATSIRVGGWAGALCVLLFFVLILSANRGCFSRAPRGAPSTPSWMLLMYFAVALLPIAWVYSLAPLLPVILYLLRQGARTTLGAGITALVLPCLGASWGTESIAPLVTANVAVGVGLIAVGRPCSFPLARSFEGLFAEPETEA